MVGRRSIEAGKISKCKQKESRRAKDEIIVEDP